MMPVPPDPVPRMAAPGYVVVVPVLNEAATIAAVLSDLLDDGTDWPILVADGGSTDGTRALVRDIAATAPRVMLFDNPGVVQSAAVNRAARFAHSIGASVLVRADAHARYQRGFARGLAQTIDTMGCDSVVVPLIATLPDRGATRWIAANVRLQSGWLGTGGAVHRSAAQNGPVDHGHHAAFRVRAFLSIGGYDAGFAANEDAEYDLRLTEAGGRIYLQNKWPVAYCPRNGPGDLFWQYWRNGRWRMMTAQKHGRRLGLRQLLPVGATAFVALSLAAGLATPAGLIPAALYFGAIGAGAARLAKGDTGLGVRIAVLAAAMHFGFGLGVIASWISAPSRRPGETIEWA